MNKRILHLNSCIYIYIWTYRYIYIYVNIHIYIYIYLIWISVFICNKIHPHVMWLIHRWPALFDSFIDGPPCARVMGLIWLVECDSLNESYKSHHTSTSRDLTHSMSHVSSNESWVTHDMTWLAHICYASWWHERKFVTWLIQWVMSHRMSHGLLIMWHGLRICVMPHEWLKMTHWMSHIMTEWMWRVRWVIWPIGCDSLCESWVRWLIVWVMSDVTHCMSRRTHMRCALCICDEFRSHWIHSHVIWHTHTQIHTYTHINTHKHTHKHTHTHTHTHIHSYMTRLAQTSCDLCLCDEIYSHVWCHALRVCVWHLVVHVCVWCHVLRMESTSCIPVCFTCVCHVI